MVYYDGKVLDNNYLSRRREHRFSIIINGLKQLLPTNNNGIATNDLWFYVIKHGYHYDRRTLLKDLIFLEADKRVIGVISYGGRGCGTKKFWNINEVN